MNHRYNALALAAAISAAAFAARTHKPDKLPPYADRVKALQDRVDAEKKKWGVTTDAQASALFPKPNVALDGPAPTVKPGSTLKVHATFNPPLGEGALVAFDCDELQLTEVKQTAASFEATVEVPPLAMPHTCHLAAHQPVTLASTLVDAFKINGVYLWSLSLSDGLKTQWEMKVLDGSDRVATSDWLRNGKSTGGRRVTLSLDPQPTAKGDHYTATVERNDGDDDALRQAAEARSEAAAAEANQTRVSNAPLAAHKMLIQRASAECRSKPPKEMGRCFKKYMGDLNSGLDRMQARAKYEQAGGRLKSAHDEEESSGGGEESDVTAIPGACARLELWVTAAGKVTGTAEGCLEGGSAKVTGTLAAEK
jgi:hypothetical protein